MNSLARDPDGLCPWPIGNHMAGVCRMLRELGMELDYDDNASIRKFAVDVCGDEGREFAFLLACGEVSYTDAALAATAAYFPLYSKRKGKPTANERKAADERFRQEISACLEKYKRTVGPAASS